MSKVVTTLMGPGERVVKVDGIYAGVITREPEGWMWTGNRKAFRTYRIAAEQMAEHPDVVAKVAERKRRGIRY